MDFVMDYKVAATGIGSVIAGTRLYYSLTQEKRRRKREYRGMITAILNQIDECKDTRALNDLHTETWPKVREASMRLLEDIPQRNQNKFKLACQRYRTITYDEITGLTPAWMIHTLFHSDDKRVKFDEISGRNKMRASLKELNKLAS